MSGDRWFESAFLQRRESASLAGIRLSPAWWSDRFGGSIRARGSRIRTLKVTLAKLGPEPVRELLPQPKVCAPLKATAARRRHDQERKGPNLCVRLASPSPSPLV